MNVVDLNTLCTVTKDIDELSTYFYKLSLSMEKMHNKGYYITNFSPKYIEYDIDKDGFVLEVEKMKPDDRNVMINSNINGYARLLSYFDNYYGGVIGKDYIKNLNNDSGVYYFHDYINNLEKSSGDGLSSTKAKVKATPAGIMFASAEKENEIDYSRAAFVTVPVMFVMAGIIVVLMIIIFSFMGS